MGFHKRSQNNSETNNDGEELCETFYINNKKNSVFQVSLSDKGFSLKKTANGIVKEQIINIEDIIGCRYMRSKMKYKTYIRSCACSSPNVKNDNNVSDENPDPENCDPSAYLYIYSYILKKGLRSHMRRERTVLTLRFRSFDTYDDNIREAEKWQSLIKRLKNVNKICSGASYDQVKMLVILNPKSGAGKARQLFHEQVVPVFVESEMAYDLCVTKCANYARELMRTKDLHNWRSVLVVGGDGIFWEVINGIMQRQDWSHVLRQTSIGIVPCGSGNGLAKSISYMFSEPYEPKPILSAALAAVRGRTSYMDLVRVETRTQIMFSFLSIGWGLISDIDIESERLRSLGYQRFTVWSLHRLISLRTYHGKLSYLINTQENEGNIKNFVSIPAQGLRHSLSSERSFGKAEIVDTDANTFGEVISLETSKSNESFRQRVDSWYSATSRKSAYFSVSDSLYQSINSKEEPSDTNGLDHQNILQTFGPSSNIPSLITPVPDTWTTEEGEYVMVHAAYQSHLGIDCFFAPSAKLNDGIIWLVIIRGGVSRSQLLSFLLNMSSGTHIPTKNNEYIKIIPVSAFRIEPTGSEGIMTVDGERVQYGSIQGEIFPGLVNVMVP